MTRASPDEHWRYELFQHLGNETNIRIPPYRIVISPSAGTEAVIEDPICGEGVTTLGEAWNTMNDRLKYRAVVQIREMFKALRSIKPENIPQRPIIADRYISRSGTNPMNQKRVYRNNMEFVNILKDSVAAVTYDIDIVRNAVEFVGELAMSRSELVFTHGNLTADNVYVSEWTGDVLAIANWSEAGYYPIYWEFIKAKLSYNNEPYFDRDGAVEMILKPWRIELALMMPAHDMIF
ncbi:phosphotransferase enzyme family protein [Colletotrichum incanum]|uniref:Phosphotransferase enzyme family protein n=1 Tax=Colletotrichum incanum TaxID=1573173 RepID=A0A167ED75_COLIC|nr:phosphotransferase enzyme family protein [Colletotrichum incanum]